MVAEDIAGLSSIIGQINREAVEAAEKITAKAKEDAKQIIKKATESANDKIEAAKQKADIVFKTEFEREETSAEHGMSQTILEEKQKLLDKSAEKLKSLDVKEYFNFLQTLISKYAQNKNGELMLSENDIKRMPDTFNSFVSENYPELKIVKSKKIDAGFVIKYGDIEENCTIDALIEENIDSIKEKAYMKLFS